MKFDIENLKHDIERIKDTHPQYADDHAFTHWWIQAVYDLKDVEKAVTGMPNDKGIDGLWIDDDKQIVNIVQIKNRTWKGKNETRQDVFQLIDNTKIFWDDAEKNNYFQTLDTGIKTELTKAIKRVKDRKYKILLSFISKGKISKELRKEAKQSAKTIKKHSKGKVEVVDYRIAAWQEVQNVYMTWDLYGAPEIGDYKIDIVAGGYMQKEMIAYNDPEKKLVTWIGTVNSKNIAKMYEEKKHRLFVTNIRGFLDKTRVNTAMIETIKKQPKDFWYYNNGITIICDEMTSDAPSGGATSWKLEKPQIINGQQTTITLAEHNHARADVIIKVIKVPLDEPSRDGLISNIVKATNWQNPIGFSDLVSNDAYQKGLEQWFRALGYFYVRKKYGKIDFAKAGLDYSPILTIHKTNMAKSVGACILDPAELRRGQKALFDEQEHYNTLFSNPDKDFYLSCFFTRRFVEILRKSQKGKNDYSKWFNTHLLWEQLRDTIESGAGAKRFRMLHEQRWKHKSAVKSLQKVILHNYKMTRKFYNKEHAEKSETDFYKKPNLPEKFEKFSKKENKQEMKQAEKLIKDFKDRLKNIN